MVTWRRPGGSWAARSLAFLLVCGLAGLSLVASWQTIATRYGLADLEWALALVVVMLVTPRAIHVVYEATVLRSWRHQRYIFADADNRRWWLRRYTTPMTWPFGVIMVALVFAWRLLLGRDVPLSLSLCTVVIGAIVLVGVLVQVGQERQRRGMPTLNAVSLRWWHALVMAAVFVPGAFVRYTWVHAVPFMVVLVALGFWTGFAVAGPARILLRVDRGDWVSWPIDRGR